MSARAVFVPVVLLLLFTVIATAVSLNATNGFDRAILLSLRETQNPAKPLGPEWLFEAVRDVTSLGSVVVCLLFAAALAAYYQANGRTSAAAFIIGSAIGALLLNDLVKAIFDRARPDALLQSARVFSSGFPSGHAALSSATWLSAAQLTEPPGRIILMSFASAVVALIGFSRIYLGLHYPTDVAAGWCVGGMWLLLCRRIFTPAR